MISTVQCKLFFPCEGVLQKSKASIDHLALISQINSKGNWDKAFLFFEQWI